jgi:hypothetical protein
MTTALDPSIDFSTVPQANILDNGGFEIWQRGTTFNSLTNSQYTADRWSAYVTAIGQTVNITRESVTIFGGTYSLKVNAFVSTSGGAAGIRQVVENFADYAGKTITFSAWVNTTITGICAAVNDSGGYFYSTPHPGDGQWHQLSITRTVASGSTFILFLVIQTITNQTGIFYVDSAVAALGSQPVTFIPTNPQVDLARCQRFFQIATSGYSFGGNQAGGANAYMFWPFTTVMRATPTITFNAPTVIVINAGASGFSAINTNTITPTALVWGGSLNTSLGSQGNPTYMNGGSITASADL